MSSLQRFKAAVAAAVVSGENAQLASMGISPQLLGALGGATGQASAAPPRHDDDGASIAGVDVSARVSGLLASLGDLWSEAQYDDLTLEAFVKNAGRT